jgi:RNA polymerase sigma factor (sigma-70 family)
MDNKPAETVSHDVDTLFRLGVVAAMSDEQLLERFAGRSESDCQIAFEAIVRRHGPMVLGVCRRVLHDLHDAEDAFQATFLVLALRAATVRKRRSLGPWLHSVAARIARRAKLVSVRRKEIAMPATGMVDPNERNLALADLESVLDEELSRLPEKYRLPVVLCYLEGRTQDDVASELGWTKGTVSGRLARAKILLQHRLVRRGLAPSAGLLAASLTSSSASAAVHAPLLNSTVRAATLASFGGAKTGLVTVEVARLVRQALHVLLLGRIAKATALCLVLGIGATAIATQVLGFARPAGPRNPGTRALPSADAKPEPRAPRLDRFGDPLPAKAIARLGTIERRHTARVVGVNFSSRDKSAVTAQSDGLVRFWDPVSGREVRTIEVTGNTPGDVTSVRQFAIAGDGRYLAAVGWARHDAASVPVSTLWIRGLADAGLERTIDVKSKDVQCLAISPASQTVATGSFAGEVKLWNVAKGECEKTVTLAANQSVFQLSYSGDGKTLATVEQGKGIKLWEPDQDRISLVAIPTTAGGAPYFSADGRYLAASTVHQETIVWDRWNHRVHLTAGGAAAGFSPDSRSLALIKQNEGRLTTIDAETGQELWKADLGSALQVTGLAYSSDGQEIIIGWGNVLRFFSAQTGGERFASEEAHTGGISAVFYTPDARALVSAGDDGTIRLWDANSSRQLKVIADPGTAHRVAMSSDGSKLAAMAIRAPSPAVRIWELKTGRLLQECLRDVELNRTEALTFSSDGTELLFYSHRIGLKRIDVATGQARAAVQPRFVLSPEDLSAQSLAQCTFSPANRYLATCTGTTTHVVELASGAERFSCPSYAMAFTPDGRGLAVASEANRDVRPAGDATSTAAVELLEFASGVRKKIVVPADRVSGLAFSPDGNVLAVGLGWHGDVIRLYSTRDGRAIDSVLCPAARTHPGALAFAPDGRSLAAGLDDTTVVIWNVESAH